MRLLVLRNTSKHVGSFFIDKVTRIWSSQLYQETFKTSSSYAQDKLKKARPPSPPATPEMHAKTSNGKVLRDTKIFRSLLRQGNLKFNVRHFPPTRLKYYLNFVRTENLHYDELTDVFFYVWDASTSSGPSTVTTASSSPSSFTAVHAAYDYDSVPIALSWS